MLDPSPFRSPTPTSVSKRARSLLQPAVWTPSSHPHSRRIGFSSVEDAEPYEKSALPSQSLDSGLLVEEKEIASGLDSVDSMSNSFLTSPRSRSTESLKSRSRPNTAEQIVSPVPSPSTENPTRTTFSSTASGSISASSNLHSATVAQSTSTVSSSVLPIPSPSPSSASNISSSCANLECKTFPSPLLSPNRRPRLESEENPVRNENQNFWIDETISDRSELSRSGSGFTNDGNARTTVAPPPVFPRPSSRGARLALAASDRSPGGSISNIVVNLASHHQVSPSAKEMFFRRNQEASEKYPALHQNSLYGNVWTSRLSKREIAEILRSKISAANADLRHRKSNSSRYNSHDKTNRSVRFSLVEEEDEQLLPMEDNESSCMPSHSSSMDDSLSSPSPSSSSSLSPSSLPSSNIFVSTSDLVISNAENIYTDEENCLDIQDAESQTDSFMSIEWLERSISTLVDENTSLQTEKSRLQEFLSDSNQRESSLRDQLTSCHEELHLLTAQRDSLADELEKHLADKQQNIRKRNSLQPETVIPLVSQLRELLLAAERERDLLRTQLSQSQKDRFVLERERNSLIRRVSDSEQLLASLLFDLPKRQSESSCSSGSCRGSPHYDFLDLKQAGVSFDFSQPGVEPDLRIRVSRGEKKSEQSLPHAADPVVPFLSSNQEVYLNSFRESDSLDRVLPPSVGRSLNHGITGAHSSPPTCNFLGNTFSKPTMSSLPTESVANQTLDTPDATRMPTTSLDAFSDVSTRSCINIDKPSSGDTTESDLASLPSVQSSTVSSPVYVSSSSESYPRKLSVPKFDLSTISISATIASVQRKREKVSAKSNSTPPRKRQKRKSS